MEIGLLGVFLWSVSCGSYGGFLWFLWWWFLVMIRAVVVMFCGYRRCSTTVLAGVEIGVVGFGWG